jgi:hypothetical protein
MLLFHYHAHGNGPLEAYLMVVCVVMVMLMSTPVVCSIVSLNYRLDTPCNRSKRSIEFEQETRRFKDDGHLYHFSPCLRLFM